MLYTNSIRRLITKPLAITTFLTLTAAAAVAQPQRPVTLDVLAGSKLWIEGGSNLHDWHCATTTLDAAIDVDPAFTKEGKLAKVLQKVQVKVPVLAIKCGKDQMDKNLYKALKAEAAPNVSYIMATFEATPGETKDEFTVRTVGTLTIAGAEKTVTIDVRATRQPDGVFKAAGSIPLLMTDFGIKPPTALLGTLRTDNKITVKFELLVAPQGANDIR